MNAINSLEVHVYRLDLDVSYSIHAAASPVNDNRYQEPFTRIKLNALTMLE